jgi:hypothetical protein
VAREGGVVVAELPLRPLRYLLANLAVKDFFDQVNIKHFDRKERKGARD